MTDNPLAGINKDCEECKGTGYAPEGPGVDSWDYGFPCGRCLRIHQARADARRTTPGYDRVREFMQKARQATPDKPCVPDEATLRLRAKLILEEALETVAAMGFDVLAGSRTGEAPCQAVEMGNLSLEFVRYPDLVGIVDGCEDVRVVTTGTLVACGVRDGQTSEAVDGNNLAKFGPGHSWREDGKLIKPPGHKPPDIEKLLRAQGWEG